MPRKKSDITYGEKLVRLLGDLSMGGRPRSLIELARQMNCSKQSVLRMVDQISRAFVPIEETKVGRRSYYHIPRPEKALDPLSMSASELTMLQMCQSFTRHLLGEKQLRESEKAIQKSSTLAAAGATPDHFAVLIPGTIDYTPRQEDIRQLIKAMEEKTICEIEYKNPSEETGKTFYVKPYKLFSYNNALYLHAGMARYPGVRRSGFGFDPLLAVHRLVKVTPTDRKFVLPGNYDFEKQFNQTFGIIKEESFRVRLELTGYAAVYAGERRFSPDQTIQKKKDGTAVLCFRASSQPEVISWVLSFGEEVKVLSPGWLVKRVKQKIAAMSRRYD
jgi:predicted DNA-binding transcriptional regulator YafY